MMALPPKVHGPLHVTPLGCSKETKQDSSMLLRVSCGGLGKQSVDECFKKQVGQVEAEIRQQQICSHPLSARVTSLELGLHDDSGFA